MNMLGASSLLVLVSLSVRSRSHVWSFATPWTAARQASLSITNSQRLLKLMSIKSVMPSNHLILCHPLLLLPSIFPNIKIFSSESVLHIGAKVLEFQLQHQSILFSIPQMEFIHHSDLSSSSVFGLWEGALKCSGKNLKPFSMSSLTRAKYDETWTSLV